MILFKRKKRHFASVEITPLIDIVFLLLIFFMISSTFSRPVIKLKLPVIARRVQDKQSKVTVAVDSAQQIFINNKQVELSELNKKLKALQPITDINFRAENTTTYEMIIKIMAELRAAGIKNIALEYEIKK